MARMNARHKVGLVVVGNSKTLQARLRTLSRMPNLLQGEGLLPRQELIRRARRVSGHLRKLRDVLNAPAYLR